MVIFATIFITGTKQVRSITDYIVPLQPGSEFYERAKLTGVRYKHRYNIFYFTIKQSNKSTSFVSMCAQKENNYLTI